MSRARALVCVLLVLPGCDLTRFTATSTAGLLNRAAPSVERQFDERLVGEALPGTIMQAEGVLRVVPDDHALALTAARAYASYAFGWVEDAEEEARVAGDDARADALHRRAIELYDRASLLARRAMRGRASGFDDAWDGPLPAFRAWLEETFTDPADAGLLFWTGYARGRYLNARWPRQARRERAFSIAMVQRSAALDAGYYGAAGLALEAYVATMRPGADLDDAEGAWQRALEVSGRSNLLIQLTMARTYARRRDDRALYVRLLREVVDAGDVDPELRLSNRLARRRALRDLRNLERAFP